MTSTDELRELARTCRVHIVNMVHRAQAGHPGGSLSEIDLLAALYKTTLRVRPDEPDWEDRDRFILSKGQKNYKKPNKGLAESCLRGFLKRVRNWNIAEEARWEMHR